MKKQEKNLVLSLHMEGESHVIQAGASYRRHYRDRELLASRCRICTGGSPSHDTPGRRSRVRPPAPNRRYCGREQWPVIAYHIEYSPVSGAPRLPVYRQPTLSLEMTEEDPPPCGGGSPKQEKRAASYIEPLSGELQQQPTPGQDQEPVPRRDEQPETKPCESDSA